MYEIWLTESAEQAYNKLDTKTKQRINNVILQLEGGNFHNKNICSLHGKYKGSLRYRMGQWRIIFNINHEKKIITIISIMPRGNVYKK